MSARVLRWHSPRPIAGLMLHAVPSNKRPITPAPVNGSSTPRHSAVLATSLTPSVYTRSSARSTHRNSERAVLHRLSVPALANFRIGIANATFSQLKKLPRFISADLPGMDGATPRSFSYFCNSWADAIEQQIRAILGPEPASISEAA